jgi:hypothetical protein
MEKLLTYDDEEGDAHSTSCPQCFEEDIGGSRGHRWWRLILAFQSTMLVVLSIALLLLYQSWTTDHISAIHST